MAERPDYSKPLEGEPVGTQKAFKWLMRRQAKRAPRLLRRFGPHDEGLVWKNMQVCLRLQLEAQFDGVEGVGRPPRVARAAYLAHLRELDYYEEGRLHEA